MAVYIDNFQAAYRNMIMCHMIADTLNELHDMAEAIGIHRRHFQNKNRHHPHYDICRSKRELAIKLGAIELDCRELVLKLKQVEHIQSWMNAVR